MKNNYSIKYFFLLLSILFLNLQIFACTPIEYDDKSLKTLHEKTFNISPGKELIVDASFGNILITTWDNNEAYIKVLGNEKTEKDVDFNITGNSEKIEVKAKHDKSLFNWFSSGYKMRVEIKVPKNFNAKVYTAGGDIRAASLSGKVELKTSGGNISLRQIEGDSKISTSGGNINIDGLKGNIHGTTSGGNITADNFTGDLNVSTSGGNIKLIGRDSRIQATTSGGNISLDYSGANNGIKLSTSGGDITIKVPAEFNAAALLSTSGGSVTSEFKGNNAVKISSSKFEADINNGGNILSAKTSGGSISLRKK
jgi:hypothetical protein